VSRWKISDHLKLAVASAAVFLLAVVGSTIYYGQRKANECAANSAEHEAPAEGFSLSRNERGAYQVEYRPKAEEHGETCFWGHTAEQWLALLTAWLVLGTALLAAFTAFLWLETSEAARKQRAADRKAHQRELRAYVHIADTLPEPGETPDGRVVAINVVIANTGQTPTRHARAYLTVLEFIGARMPNDFRFFDVYMAPDPRPSLFVLGPGQTTRMQVPPMSMELLRRVAGGVSTLYFWGWVEYNDIFAGSKRHRTEFCYEVVVEMSGPNTANVACRHHDQYNGADDDCMYRPLPLI
jgi:hypothetical protein